MTYLLRVRSARSSGRMKWLNAATDSAIEGTPARWSKAMAATAGRQFPPQASSGPASRSL